MASVYDEQIIRLLHEAGEKGMAVKILSKNIFNEFALVKKIIVSLWRNFSMDLKGDFCPLRKLINENIRNPQKYINEKYT